MWKKSIMNIFWFCVLHGAKLFQLLNLNRPTIYLFVPKGFQFISVLSISPDCLFTMQHSLYICYFKNDLLFISFLVSSPQDPRSILTTPFLASSTRASWCFSHYTTMPRSIMVACWMTYLPAPPSGDSGTIVISPLVYAALTGVNNFRVGWKSLSMKFCSCGVLLNYVIV